MGRAPRDFAPRSPTNRSRRSARAVESTDSSTSKSSMARAALFFWRWPTRCQRADPSCGIFSAASCTRFSPKRSCPAACASSRRSAGPSWRPRSARPHRVADRSGHRPRQCARGSRRGQRPARRWPARRTGRVQRTSRGVSGCGGGRPGCPGPLPWLAVPDRPGPTGQTRRARPRPAWRRSRQRARTGRRRPCAGARAPA